MSFVVQNITTTFKKLASDRLCIYALLAIMKMWQKYDDGGNRQTVGIILQRQMKSHFDGCLIRIIETMFWIYTDQPAMWLQHDLSGANIRGGF